MGNAHFGPATTSGLADPVTENLTDDVPNGIEVWLANPDGTFSETPISYNATTQTVGWNGITQSIAPADFNRDSRAAPARIRAAPMYMGLRTKR